MGLSRNQGIKHTVKNFGMRPQAREFPMMCVLSFVYVCNARCPNCPYNNSDIRAKYHKAKFMSPEVFKSIANQCGEYKAYIRISGGGEPMLHPQSVALMEYAKKAGAKVGLITNGSVFSEDILKRLIHAEIDLIEFSVDAGDEKTYSKVRTGLDWHTVVRNVERAVVIRNAEISGTKIIASIINQKEVAVKKAERFWQKIVDNVQIRKFLTWGYVGNKSADPTPYLSPADKIPCPWLFERLNIDSKGNVTICGEDIAFKESFANIKEKTIKEIWHSDKFKYFREKHLAGQGDEIAICRTCPDWKYRSWKHNYWKIIRKAEQKRTYRITK